MTNNFGPLIRKVVKLRGMTQLQLGDKINRTKQGVSSMFNRKTIEVDLLAQISDVLDYDFFAHLYESPNLKRFKEQQLKEYVQQIEGLRENIKSLENELKFANNTIDIQKKYILQIESKK